MDPIVVSSLRKSYGSVEAVRGVSFAVEKGSIFGLIGPDGGGKTTILRSVVSLLSIDSGEVRFMGKAVDRDPDYVRSHIGYMPQRFSLYQDLTVEENLRFFGDLFAVPRKELPPADWTTVRVFGPRSVHGSTGVRALRRHEAEAGAVVHAGSRPGSDCSR